MKFIAVPEIQCPQTGDFFLRFAPQSATPGRMMGQLGEWVLLLDVTQDTVSDLLQGVVIAQLVKSEIALCPRWF